MAARWQSSSATHFPLNSISHHKINAPDWTLLLPGLVCGLIGVILGHIISNHSQKREQFKNPHQMQ